MWWILGLHQWSKHDIETFLFQTILQGGRRLQSTRVVPLSLSACGPLPGHLVGSKLWDRAPGSVISHPYASSNLLKHWINTPEHLFKQSLLKLNSHGSLIISFHGVWLMRGMVELEVYPIHFSQYEADEVRIFFFPPGNRINFLLGN